MIDHLLPLERFGIVVFVVLIAGLLLTYLRQPRVAGYLVVGMFLGPHVFGLSPPHEMTEFLSEMGVVFLLFFVGMEVSVQRLIQGWRISVIGTLGQVLLSVGFVWLMGLWHGWNLGEIVLIGFIISLSSTAVVLTVLQNWNELNTTGGQDVLGILLVQDLMVVPMLIILGLLGGESPTAFSVGLEMVGGLLICGLIGYVVLKGKVTIPTPKVIEDDDELEVFLSLAICLGLAILTTVFGLSEALGAFAAGIFVSAAGWTDRHHRILHPFKVVFMALFFVSIGMLVNLPYVLEHWGKISILVLLIFIVNTVINALILRAGKRTLKDSWYGGFLLSQIGEFSFVLASVGMASGIWSEGREQVAYATIAMSLILSPLWIGMGKALLKR
ncbi:MAG: cation:proton antiporter [Nitrospirales bacterium]|nr:cation:proton antiporter [Nitrospirales bacterium]